MIDADGYVLIKHLTHPFRMKANYVREHRLVMEASIGRILDPKEVVHHINGNKADNRLENLLLLPSHSDHQTLERIGHKFPRKTTRRIYCATCGQMFFRSAASWPAKFCSWECRYPHSTSSNRSQV